MSKFYSREIEMPKTKREGLENFVQMIINRIEAGDHNEALLKAVDLLQDIQSGIYDAAMSDAEGRSELAAELSAKHTAEIISANQDGYARGVSDEKNRMAQTLGLAA